MVKRGFIGQEGVVQGEAPMSTEGGKVRKYLGLGVQQRVFDSSKGCWREKAWTRKKHRGKHVKTRGGG